MRFRVLNFLIILILLTTTTFAGNIEIYLAPDGGFSPFNNQRYISLINGKKVKATLNNAVLDMVQRTPDNGIIKMVMYNFDYAPVFEELIKKAKRGVTVKVILDNCAQWTQPNVKKFIKRIKKEHKLASQKGYPFDYQLKVVIPKVMKFHNRLKVLDNNKTIYGTMHEKFGVFYEDKNSGPLHCFAGSSNLSRSSGMVFAENRLFFKNTPSVAIRFANQFVRLWNYYSVRRAGKITPEFFIPEPINCPVEVIFNGEHEGSLFRHDYKRIDKRLMEILDTLDEHGTVDIAMFSFTHIGLAEKILQLARTHKNAKFRLLFDHSMLDPENNKIGLMPPYIEEVVRKEKLSNVKIRYKFRANAYSWNKDTKSVTLNHFRSPLLHHKVLIVNKKIMAIGSYNWSGGAEIRNFEDIIILDSSTNYGRRICERFLAEYEYLWNKLYDIKNSPYKPYVITYKYGKKLSQKIKKVLSDFINSKVRYLIDRFGPLTINDIIKKSRKPKLTRKQVVKSLAALINARLVTYSVEKNKIIYKLAD